MDEEFGNIKVEIWVMIRVTGGDFELYYEG